MSIPVYNRAQNIYASAVAEQANRTAIAAAVKAGDTTVCQVKIVPTDIFGNILEGATVTINSGPGGLVSAFGNIADVEPLSDVTYSVTCEGYESASGAISAIKVSQLIHVTLQPAAAADWRLESEAVDTQEQASAQGSEEPEAAAGPDDAEAGA